LRAAAAEAVRLAMLALQEDDDPSVDSPADAWAEPREWTGADGIALRTVTEDAGRWFDWNNLSLASTNAAEGGRPARSVLADLMAACGREGSEARAEALADYTDADAEGVYEAAFYRLGDRPFAPPDRPLWAPGELLDVHGFTPGLFAPLPDRGNAGELTECCALVPAAPAGAPRPVNLNTAGRAVLLGVFGPGREQAVRELMAMRAVHPLESAAMLAAVDPAAAAELGPWTAVCSRHFRIRALASMPDASASVRVVAWVEREDGGRVRILQWLETEGGAA
jgi:type II secretory pathway component PulK